MPFLAFFGVKTVALQLVLTLPQQRLHYSPRLLPIPPTYKLNGSSFGRPDVDLMFAKWAFNNVPQRSAGAEPRAGFISAQPPPPAAPHVRHPSSHTPPSPRSIPDVRAQPATRARRHAAPEKRALHGNGPGNKTHYRSPQCTIGERTARQLATPSTAAGAPIWISSHSPSPPAQEWWAAVVTWWRELGALVERALACRIHLRSDWGTGHAPSFRYTMKSSWSLSTCGSTRQAKHNRLTASVENGASGRGVPFGLRVTWSRRAPHRRFYR